MTTVTAPVTLGSIQASWGESVADAIGELQAMPPVYANNAAALAGGLTAGDRYRTGGDPDLLCVVHAAE